MRLVIAFLLWCLLLVCCPPLAVLAAPFLFLAWVAWKLIALAGQALFALLKALLFLPAWLLGGRAAA